MEWRKSYSWFLTIVVILAFTTIFFYSKYMNTENTLQEYTILCTQKYNDYSTMVYKYLSLVYETSKERNCTNSGGTIGTSQCCKSVIDFPNTCLIGACGCALTDSHEVKVCNCQEGKCFNGNACT
jgi:hypothetical protein